MSHGLDRAGESAMPRSTSELLARLLEVRRTAVAREEAADSELAALPDAERVSAINLIHYLAVRSFDLRPEQRQLAMLGLSSLGRAEAHVLATLDAVIVRLAADNPDRALPSDLGRRGPLAQKGEAILRRRARQLFGPEPAGHSTRVMVTLPSEAAQDRELVDSLVEAGMTIARVNCAHDEFDAWEAMARHVREAAFQQDRDVKLAFDLPGPKVRTGPLAPGPEVIRARPNRDQFGRATEPARIRFVPAGSGAAGPRPKSGGDGKLVIIPVEGVLLDDVQVGDELCLRDSRGRRRGLAVSASTGDEVVECCSDRTTYFASGQPIRAERRGELITEGRVGRLPAISPALRLHEGDALELRLGPAVGGPGDPAAGMPAHIGIDTPEVFRSVEVGHRVLFDEGLIEGTVVDVGGDRIHLEIVRPGSSRLRAAKGVNFPDTSLGLSAVTERDLVTLECVAPLADAISLSYVGGPDDLRRFHRALETLDAHEVGVILKIEQRAGFEALPSLLVQALRRPPVGVMVARGDLAVEVGYGRLAEIQEEILWLSEAAHVPVIWATQVLEQLSKRGAPSRAEITDAAWSGRAECVMLNKGPFIPDTIRFLDDLLTRMRAHFQKRTPLLRRLGVAAATGPGGLATRPPDDFPRDSSA